MAHSSVRQYRYVSDKKALLSRMKKVEGQAKGIQRMIDDGRYCVDILQQLNALTAAANEVAFLILQGHIQGCVSDAIRDGGGEGHIRELMDVLRRGIRR